MEDPREGNKWETEEKEEALDWKVEGIKLNDLVICKCFIISCRTFC